MIKFRCDRYQNADNTHSLSQIRSCSNVFHCGMTVYVKSCENVAENSRSYRRIPMKFFGELEVLLATNHSISVPIRINVGIQKFLTEFCKNFAGLAAVVEVCDVRYQYNVISTQQKQRSLANRIRNHDVDCCPLTAWVQPASPNLRNTDTAR